MSARIGIGVDVGGTKILLVAIDDAHQVIGEVRVDSPSGLEGLRPAIEPALVELADSVAGERTVAIGLALPGLVDADGVLRAAPNLGANRAGFDLRAELGSPLVDAVGALAAPTPVALENDATAAAYAEAILGAGKGHENVLSVSIGTGIGGGLVVNGRLAKGAHGYAGEIGHMIVDRGGPICACGRRGCWEALASGSALGRLASEAAADGDGRPIRGEEVVDAARRGDERAIGVIDQYARLVGLGLANACEILDPGVIVLGGGLVTSSDVILGPVRQAFEQISRPALERHGSDLVVATLGARAAAIGVALVALGGGAVG